MILGVQYQVSHSNPKDVNCPKAESSKLYNVLKIALIVTNDDQKYVYKILVWYKEILKSWLPILNQKSSPPSILSSKSSFPHSPTSNLLCPTSILHFQLFFLPLIQKYQIFDLKCPQNSVISNKMSARAACTACSFFQVCAWKTNASQP